MMSDITSRWDGNYYLTKDQYEDAKKYFETKINSPNALDTSKTGCGPTCLSDIIGEYKNLISYYLKVKRIIFNPPATVVFWENGTKTVVKCSEDDEFNSETGVAMCFMKKIYFRESF